MPAAAEVQESGCDWDDIADDAWAKCLQDTPAAFAGDRKIVIEFSAFEACLRALLLPDEDWQRDATPNLDSPQQESRHCVHHTVALPPAEGGVHSDRAQAVEQVCG
jgi:hypothetical protein